MYPVGTLNLESVVANISERLEGIIVRSGLVPSEISRVADRVKGGNLCIGKKKNTGHNQFSAIRMSRAVWLSTTNTLMRDSMAYFFFYCRIADPFL